MYVLCVYGFNKGIEMNLVSEKIDVLSEAIVKCNKIVFPTFLKSLFSSKYSYENIKKYSDAISENGLTISDTNEECDNQLKIRTILKHDLSDQWVSIETSIKKHSSVTFNAILCAAARLHNFKKIVIKQKWRK
jgi:hypothetical protein